MNKQNKIQLIDTKNSLLVARGWEQCGVGKTSEGDQEVQASNYKISKSWGCNIQRDD